MNRQLLILRLLQALIVIQLLVGVLSIFTLDIGRAIAVFGSAALVYLGITIIQQLVLIRELLMYSSGQQPVRKEAAPATSILSQLRKNKKETTQDDEPVRNPRQDVREPVAREPRVYATRGQAPQSE